MISRWIIVSLLLLLQHVAGVPSEKSETVPNDSKIFIENRLSPQELVHSRQRRVGIEPTKKSVTAKDAENTAVMNRSTTTNTASEAEDMVETSVNPKDDDDVQFTTAKTTDKSSFNTSTIVTTNVNQTKTEVKNSTLATTTVAPIKSSDERKKLNETQAAKNATMPPDIFPKDGNISIDNAPPDVQERLKNSEYATASGEPNVTATPGAITPLVDVVGMTSTIQPSTTTELLTITLKSREELIEENSDIKVLEHKNEKTGMPTGIVALIIAIAFAGAAVIGYVGLVVWRRYLEYRYGNRELLVNDFDANDINNFEL